MNLDINLTRRMAGIALLLAALVAFRPETGGVIHQLLIPALMGIAALLITRAYLAVALATCALTAAGTQLAAEDPLLSIVYPLLSILAAGVAAYLVIQRFRGRIAATHDERWQARSGENGGGSRGKST